MSTPWRAVLVALAALAAAACAGADRAVPDARGASAASPARAARVAAREPGALATVAAETVVGWRGPDGAPFEVALRTADPAAAHARRFGTISRRVALRVRRPDLGQYPCGACHMGRAVVMSDDRRIEDAHADLEVTHPAQAGAACSTCHAAADVEQLALKNGTRVSLDHAYRLCAQCHFGEVSAWAGGGHGKRLDGWQGRRVVLGCADCHDPHRPRLEPRVPFTAPRIARRGSAEP